MSIHEKIFKITLKDVTYGEQPFDLKTVKEILEDTCIDAELELIKIEELES